MVEVELNFDFVRGLFMCQRVFKEAWSSKSPNEIVIKTRLIIITKTQCSINRSILHHFYPLLEEMLKFLNQ